MKKRRPHVVPLKPPPGRTSLALAWDTAHRAERARDVRSVVLLHVR